MLDPARFAPYLAVHLLPQFAHPTGSAAFWCDGAEGRCVEIEVACKGGGAETAQLRGWLIDCWTFSVREMPCYFYIFLVVHTRTLIKWIFTALVGSFYGDQVDGDRSIRISWGTSTRRWSRSMIGSSALQHVCGLEVRIRRGGGAATGNRSLQSRTTGCKVMAGWK